MPTKVVHCKREDYDVYIGRPNPENNWEESEWGNPFKIGPDGTREEVLEKYEAWFRERPNWVNELQEIQGKTLGCWCKPQACHGDLLARLADSIWGPTEPSRDWSKAKSRIGVDAEGRKALLEDYFDIDNGE